MILSERLKKIKTPHDIRMEKVRLRYESMRAEDAMNDSLGALGRMFTVFSFIKKTGHRLRFIYSMVSGITRLAGRFLYKKVKKIEDPCYTSMEDD